MRTWFLKHPTYQYGVDVKAIAKKHKLKIVDAVFDDGTGVDGFELDKPKTEKKGK